MRIELSPIAGLLLVSLKDSQLAGGPPPTEFRIFPFSEAIETDKGTFKFDETDCDILLAERSRRKARIQIDYDHLAIKAEKPGDGKAAGWCDLEKRPDGLWAVNVKWTPTAFKMLEDGEYASISPFFAATKKDKHIVMLMNIAITNLPATFESEQLVAATSFFIESTKQEVPTTSRGSGRSTKEGKAMKHKMGGYLTKQLAAKKMSLKELASKSGIEEERCRGLSDGDEPTAEEMKSLGKAFGMKDGEIDESLSAFNNGDAEDAKDSEDEDDDDAPAPKAPKTAARRVSASRKAADDEVALDLVELTGTTDPKKQSEMLRNVFSMAEEFGKSKKALDELMLSSQAARRESLIQKGKTEGKLTPALLRFWAKRPLEEFELFLASAPVLSVQHQSLREGEPSAAAAILSHEELEVCRLTHASPEKLAEFVQGERTGKNRQLIYDTYMTDGGMK